MDQPAPLPANIAELPVIERFAALIDSLCALLMSALPAERERTWFGQMIGTLFAGASRRMMARLCADLRAMTASMRALAAQIAAAGAPGARADIAEPTARTDAASASARRRASAPQSVVGPRSPIRPRSAVGVPPHHGSPSDIALPSPRGRAPARYRPADARPTIQSRSIDVSGRPAGAANFCHLGALDPSHAYFVAIM